MNRNFRLVTNQVRARAVEAIWQAEEGMCVVIRPPKRSLDQSALFHAICGDLAKQLPYAGKRRTLEEWKFLLVSGHSVATRESVEIVPGLESEFVSLRESTASMGVARMSSLIEYSLAYATQQGVKLSA